MEITVLEPFLLVFVKDIAYTLFEELLDEHTFHHVGNNILDRLTPSLGGVLAVLECLDESISKFLGNVGRGASYDVLHHFIDDSNSLFPEFLYLLFPLLNLSVVGLFLALLIRYLVLY